MYEGDNYDSAEEQLKDIPCRQELLNSTILQVTVTWGNIIIQGTAPHIEHLFLRQLLLLEHTLAAGLTEAQRSQVACLGHAERSPPWDMGALGHSIICCKHRAFLPPECSCSLALKNSPPFTEKA